MLLHGYHANGGYGLPGDEEGSGKKCGEAAEGIAGNSSLSEGDVTGKGRMVILNMPNHSEKDVNRMGSMRRRSGLWNHLIWSYG